MVSDGIGPPGIGDVDLDHHKVRPVAEVERLHMLVHQRDLGVGGAGK
jgi:hypothetical protein